MRWLQPHGVASMRATAAGSAGPPKVLPLLLLCASAAVSLDNGAGLKPPLGWSSWNHFHQDINASILMEVADAMASNGLRDAGYIYINLDDGWAVNRTAAGHLRADPALFPPSTPGMNDGIKLVADYIHAKVCPKHRPLIS